MHLYSGLTDRTRKIFTALEQLKQQNEELRSQMNNQTALLQLLVGRVGAVDEPSSQLPETISLPCSSLQDLQHVDELLSDRGIRASLFIAACIKFNEQ